MIVGGSWFGLIFKGSFPHLGRVVVSHTVQGTEGTVLVMALGSPTGDSEPCGWVGLCWLRPQLKVWPSVAQLSVAVTHEPWFACVGGGRTRLAESSTAAL